VDEAVDEAAEAAEVAGAVEVVAAAEHLKRRLRISVST
jgi:hypothetical protein